MAFVSPPQRTIIPTVVARKRGELLWRNMSLKTLLLIFKRWGIAVDPTGNSDNGSSEIIDTQSAMSLVSVAAHPDAVPTFALLYCKKHRLRPDRFVVSVFWKTIFPRAHFWGYPIFVIWSREFSVDRDFIAQAGRVETMQQYMEVEEVFHRWPGCRSFLRGRLGLRVSSRRVRRLAAALFADVR